MKGHSTQAHERNSIISNLIMFFQTPIHSLPCPLKIQLQSSFLIKACNRVEGLNPFLKDMKDLINVMLRCENDV